MAERSKYLDRLQQSIDQWRQKLSELELTVPQQPTEADRERIQQLRELTDDAQRQWDRVSALGDDDWVKQESDAENVFADLQDQVAELDNMPASIESTGAPVMDMAATPAPAKAAAPKKAPAAKKAPAKKKASVKKKAATQKKTAKAKGKKAAAKRAAPKAKKAAKKKAKPASKKSAGKKARKTPAKKKTGRKPARKK